MKFSSTPTTSVWKVFQPLTSKSAHPYSVALSFPNNFLSPRPGSTKWETIVVSITTLVLHDSPQEHIPKPRTSSLSRIFIMSPNPACPTMVVENFQTYGIQITGKCFWVIPCQMSQKYEKFHGNPRFNHLLLTLKYEKLENFHPFPRYGS